MSRRTVQVNAVAYLIADDDPPPLADRLWALAGVRLTDELNGRPPAGAVTLTSDIAGGGPRVAEGGLAGVVGTPRSAFPALTTQGYTVHLRVAVEGYVPRTVPIAIPQDLTFPATFSPQPLVDLALRRQPTVVRGRVVQMAGGKPVPVAGATVTVTGVWWPTPPPANLIVPPSAPDLVSLASPLYFDRTPAAGQCSAVVLSPVLGDDKFTTDDVPAGANPVRLSNQQNVTAGDVLLLDPDDPELAEYLPVQSIAGATTADQPAAFTLAYPPARPHRKGAIARKVNSGAAGPPKALVRDGWAGDTCVFLANVTGLSASQQVRISGGPGPDEYHTASTFSAVSDAAGYYRLPPLSRVAQLDVSAAQGSQSGHQTFQPDYALGENVLDLRLS
jgi:hypothetical protein